VPSYTIPENGGPLQVCLVANASFTDIPIEVSVVTVNREGIGKLESEE